MLWALRVTLYLQMLLGLGRFFGLIENERVWETHVSLGILAAVLAVYVLRPDARVPKPGLRAAARFLPLMTLFTGLVMYYGAAGGTAYIVLHMALGLGTVGLVEAAAARERRASGAGG